MVEDSHLPNVTVIQPDLLHRKPLTTGKRQNWPFANLDLLSSIRTAPRTSFHILETPDQSFMDQPVEVPPIGQWPWTRKALTPHRDSQTLLDLVSAH